MKIIVISDIHGIKTNLEHIKKKFYELKCNKLIVLGDLFNGPKTVNTDKDYIKDFLNEFSKNIIVMKGNTDYISDFNSLKFNVHTELHVEEFDSEIFYFNHGDVYNYDNLNEIKSGILIYGHEHIPYIRKKDNVLCINPGSISLSRSSFLESYLYYDNGNFIIYDIDDNVLDEYKNTKCKKKYF